MSKAGTRRADKRWLDDEGTMWASEFECKVYEGLRAALGSDRVKRCTTEDGDSFDYTTPIKGGYCDTCGGVEVNQRRVYTPDIRILPLNSLNSWVYIEAKGYFPKERRNLLRYFTKTGEDIDLVVILQNNSKATSKRSLSEWITSYMGCDSLVWNPCLKPTKPRPHPEKAPDKVVQYFI